MPTTLQVCLHMLVHHCSLLCAKKEQMGMDGGGLAQAFWRPVRPEMHEAQQACKAYKLRPVRP